MADPAPGARRTYRVADEAPAIVLEALAAAGWEETDGEDWLLCWSSAVPGSDLYAQLSDGRRINHLPAISALGNKERLLATAAAVRARLRARGIEPSLALPRTYVMPGEYEALQAYAHEHRETVWIQKPKASARGEGVSLVEDVRWVEAGENWLVQEYVANPHLIDGFKYTLRCYAAITALDPLSAFVFDDGFTKFASRPFRLDPVSRTDRFRHLTNPDVLAHDESLSISERNLTRPAYAALLREEGHDPDAVFSRVSEMIVEAVAGSRESLARGSALAGEHSGDCFELLGFDVLIDEEMRPWVLECNVSPSLSVEAAGASDANRAEAELKQRLIRSLLEVTGLGPPIADCGFQRVLPAAGASAPRALAAMALPRPADVAASDGEPPVLRAAGGVESWTLDGSLVLHLSGAEEFQLLDPLAAYLWAAFNEGLAPAEMVAELLESFPQAAGRAHADVWNALGYWVEAGLVRSGSDEPSGEVRERTGDLPFVAWNRQRLYALLGARVSVLVPDAESERWLDVAMAGMAEHESADSVSAAIEVAREDGAWVVVGPGWRSPCVSLRQLGPAVRELVIGLAAQRVAGAAIRATLIAWDSGQSVLLSGAPDVRAQLARACIADGAVCLADDLVELVVDDDGRPALAPWRVAIEESLAANFYGPLPGPSDPGGAVTVTARGAFSRYWSPPAGSAAPLRTVRPTVAVAISPSGSPGSAFAPLPVGPLDALSDLLAARAGGVAIAAAPLAIAVGLVPDLRSFRASAGDPLRSVAILRELLAGGEDV